MIHSWYKFPLYRYDFYLGRVPMHIRQLGLPWWVSFEMPSVEDAIIQTAKTLHHCDFKHCLIAHSLHQDALPPLVLTHLPSKGITLNTSVLRDALAWPYDHSDIHACCFCLKGQDNGPSPARSSGSCTLYGAREVDTASCGKPAGTL